MVKPGESSRQCATSEILKEGGLFVDVVADTGVSDFDRSLGSPLGRDPGLVWDSSHPRGVVQVPLGSPSPRSVGVSSVSVSSGASGAVAVAIAGAIDCGEFVMLCSRFK